MLRFRVPDGDDGRRRSRARRGRVRQRHDRGLRARARQRHAGVHPRQRRRRHRDGHHPRRARRGAPAEHAQAADDLAGARPAPPVWAHVPVLVNEQRKKLSKRRDKVALEQYRDEGYLADAMVNYLMTLGWSPGDDRDRAVVADRADVPARGRQQVAGLLRPQEARRVQRRVHPQCCRSTSSSTACEPWLPADRGIASGSRAIAPHIQQRLVTLADAATVGRLHVRRRPGDRRGGVGEGDSRPSSRRRCCATWSTAYETCDWDAATLKSVMDDAGRALRGQAARRRPAARVAVTGRSVGPAAVRGARSDGPRRVAAQTARPASPDCHDRRSRRDSPGVSDPGRRPRDRSRRWSWKKVAARGLRVCRGGRASATTWSRCSR